MERIPPELTDAARLRCEATPEERILWSVLKNYRPRFTRQLVVDRFIIDMACQSARIAIEIDGGNHGEEAELAADAARTAALEAYGWTVLRFWNNEVRGNLEGVVSAILEAVARGATHPQPLPFREGRRRG